MRGEDLAVFLRRYVLNSWPARLRVGRAVTATERRRLERVLARLGLAGAEAATVAQWLVTELVVPPSPALQLRLFGPEG